MKTIILYATKYGASKEIAQKIAVKIPDSVTCDLKIDKVPPLETFDCVIIGGSLYAGMLRKEAKKFIKENAGILIGKKLGFFLSGMTESENHHSEFKTNIPEEVLKCAIATAFAGGIFDPIKTNSFERFIYKLATKQTEYVNNISDEKIEKFVRELIK